MPENTVTLNLDAKYKGTGRNSIKSMQKDLRDTSASLKQAERSADDFGDEAESAGRQTGKGFTGANIATVALGNALGMVNRTCCKIWLTCGKVVYWGGDYNGEVTSGFDSDRWGRGRC